MTAFLVPGHHGALRCRSAWCEHPALKEPAYYAYSPSGSDKLGLPATLYHRKEVEMNRQGWAMKSEDHVAYKKLVSSHQPEFLIMAWEQIVIKAYGAVGLRQFRTSCVGPL